MNGFEKKEIEKNLLKGFSKGGQSTTQCHQKWRAEDSRVRAEFVSKSSYVFRIRPCFAIKS